MDTVNLILTNPAMLPSPAEKLSRAEKLSDQAKEKFAGDFESIFVNKLLDAMQSTIGEWGFEKDGASAQMNGMFSMYLAQQVSESGGLGLAREIYNSLKQPENACPKPEAMDNNL